MSGSTSRRIDSRAAPSEQHVRGLLQSWLDQRASTSSSDLLFQVMREVETVEQKGSTRAWISWFADSPAAGWMMATAAVAVLAVAVVVFVSNPFGTAPPAGGGATPTPTATVEPTPTPYPTPLPLSTEGLVDQLLADWNAGDYEAAMQIYSPVASFRWADNQGGWNREASGAAQIKETFAGTDVTFTRTGSMVQQGSWVAVPVTYELDGRQGDAIAVLEVRNGFVPYHFVFGADQSPVSAAQPASEAIVQVVDGLTAALNAHDGEAHASFFASTGQMRDFVNQGVAPFEYLSQAAIAEYTVAGSEANFHLVRAGAVLQEGAFAIVPWTASWTNRTAAGVTVLQLDAANLILNCWVVGD
jgi:hypothetical protein